jgi:hypothetical protein
MPVRITAPSGRPAMRKRPTAVSLNRDTNCHPRTVGRTFISPISTSSGCAMTKATVILLIRCLGRLDRGEWESAARPLMNVVRDGLRVRTRTGEAAEHRAHS